MSEKEFRRELIEGEKKLEIYRLGDAPAFFIPFLTDDHRFKGLELYKQLIKRGILAFWRSFGINGYFNSKNSFSLQLTVNNFGLPIYFGKGDNSFVIKSPAGFFDVGSEAIVASYKLANMDREGKFVGSMVCFSKNVGPDCAGFISIVDHKGTNLKIYFPGQIQIPSVGLPSPQDLGLSPIGEPQIKTYNHPLIIKIDVNGSTIKKEENGWLEGERNFTQFLTNVLTKIQHKSPETIVVDPIGESVQLICHHPQLVPPIHQALRATFQQFGIPFTAVGIRLPEVDVVLADGRGLFTIPQIEEGDWFSLELRHKQRVAADNLRPTSFVIE